jgi:hypothetical protein
VFFQQVNALHTLSFIDISHTFVNLNQLLSKITEDRTKLQIKCCPTLAHLNLSRLSSFLNEKISLKLPSAAKETLLSYNPSLQRILL